MNAPFFTESFLNFIYFINYLKGMTNYKILFIIVSEIGLDSNWVHPGPRFNPFPGFLTTRENLNLVNL